MYTLQPFMQKICGYICIYIYSLSDTQLAVLGKIQMKRLFRSMELFLEWLQGGLYDFSSLPFSIFKHLENEDMETLMNIPDKYPCMCLNCITETCTTVCLAMCSNHLVSKTNILFFNFKLSNSRVKDCYII